MPPTGRTGVRAQLSRLHRGGSPSTKADKALALLSQVGPDLPQQDAPAPFATQRLTFVYDPVLHGVAIPPLVVQLAA
jgi:hypothetical protein